MNWNVQTILAGIAGLLAVVSFFKPQWPLLSVAVLLLAIAIFVK
jgi:hypothetical protein